MAANLLIRHIQDHDEANTTLEHYWGYADRVMPCTNDKGTCAYLAAVYGMHKTSMTYTFILWGVLLCILVAWVTLRGWRMGGPSQSIGSSFDVLCDMGSRIKRRWLLPSTSMRWLFGRVSRLQVAILACLTGYLLVFSLVGIVYETWITPVEGTKLFNTRTGLGGFADRVGALAYALTPFTVLLSNRESVLSLLTGIPYQHFNFLHRWTGRIIFAQSFLHTLGWTIVEGRLYRPQPEVYTSFIKQFYAIWGVIAMFLLTLMLLLSTKTAIRWFGYKFFKISHWFIAVLYIAACWAHWDRLWCWMVASLALIAIDQVIRAIRTLHIHMGGSMGYDVSWKCAQAEVRVLGRDDDIVLRYAN